MSSLFLAGLLSLVVGASAPPAAVTGRWLTAGGQAIVEIAPCGANMCGRITRVMKPRPGGPVVDVNNPDPAKRRQPIEGLTILTGFVPKASHWAGQVYDPQSGRSYRSELRAEGATLRMKGCYGPFCRSQDWTRTR